MNSACATAGPRRCADRVSVITEDYVMVDTHLTSLGFTAADAADARQAAANVLADLAKNARGMRPVIRCRPATLDLEQLRLPPERAVAVLEEVREASARLRRRLDPLAGLLESSGCFEPGRADPTLEFLEHAKAPSVPWDLLYEGSPLDDLDWRRFWGFRVPITRWRINGEANETIKICNGVFSVVCSTLLGSGPEIDTLVEEIDRQAPGLAHVALADAMRRRVEQEVVPFDPPEPDNWLRFALQRLLAQGPPASWKRKALVDLLRLARKDHPLIHFACHGESEDASTFFSRLCFTVGGEEMALTMTLLEALKEPPAGLGQRRVGPLVFLNACNTDRPRAGSLSFPEAWISYGAAAVVATLCPVPDDFALAFSRHFYGLVLGGRANNLAEALLETRCHFMREFNNPLGLAYVLYAKKATRLELAVGPPGGAP